MHGTATASLFAFGPQTHKAFQLPGQESQKRAYVYAWLWPAELDFLGAPAGERVLDAWLRALDMEELPTVTVDLDAARLDKAAVSPAQSGASSEAGGPGENKVPAGWPTPCIGVEEHLVEESVDLIEPVMSAPSLLPEQLAAEGTDLIMPDRPAPSLAAEDEFGQEGLGLIQPERPAPHMAADVIRSDKLGL